MNSNAPAVPQDRHYGYKATALIILTLVIPSVITLMSINEARSPMFPSPHGKALSPYGYTLSLTLFTIPVIVLAFWFFRHSRLDFQRGAFWRTLACLIPMGFLLDLIWGCTFFTFPNKEAVMGIWIPARGGVVPLEEFFFYSFGFLAVLMTYIWLDEYWLRAYHVDRHRVRVREIPSLFQFHGGPLIIGGALFLVALAYKKLASDHPEGIPGYFLFEIMVAILPTMVLYKTAAPFINWRALTFTYVLLMLISLMWEATVALPYGWWGYQPDSLMGITISAWTDLPLEEPCLWSCVSIATIVWYESMKVFLAKTGTTREVLFGKRNHHHATLAAVTEPTAPIAPARSKRKRKRSS